MRGGDHNIAPDEWMDVRAAIEDHSFASAEDFVSFSRLLERSYHNGIHGAIGGRGGHMASMTSPYDPVFWLHHAFVDYMWKVWQTHHVKDADHKAGSMTVTGLEATTGEQQNSDFERSMHMLVDNPETEGHDDFTCVEYSERYSSLCPGKEWINDCMKAIAVNSTLRVQVHRVEASIQDPITGKLSDICSPADESQTRHAKIWLDSLKGMGMMTDAEVKRILEDEEADAQSFQALMPNSTNIDNIPEAERECSQQLCVNTVDVRRICRAYFPKLMTQE